MKDELLKYYMVIAKCGHVGKKNYIPIKFAVMADSGKEAARIAREFPRVKHNHKDAILDVKHISYEEYLEIRKNNDEDPYLHCHSKQEQSQIIDLLDRLEVDNHNKKTSYDKKIRKEKILFKLKKYQILEKQSYMEDYY